MMRKEFNEAQIIKMSRFSISLHSLDFHFSVFYLLKYCQFYGLSILS